MSRSDLGSVSVDGPNGRLTITEQPDGTFRALYDTKQDRGVPASAQPGDIVLELQVEVDDDGNIVSVTANEVGKGGARYDDFDDELEEAVRLLEDEVTTNGAELFAPDYRQRMIYPGGERDYIDTAERPDPDDALANAIYDMYGFKHRGQVYRFDIEASSGNWVKFSIVDEEGNYVAADRTVDLRLRVDVERTVLHG